MVTVNAMGDKCPVPVIKTKKALDALTAPETIKFSLIMRQQWLM